MSPEEYLFELFFKLALCFIIILTFTCGLLIFALFALAQLYVELFLNEGAN